MHSSREKIVRRHVLTNYRRAILSTNQIPPVLHLLANGISNMLWAWLQAVFVFSPLPSPVPGALFVLGPVIYINIYQKLAALRSFRKHTKPPAMQVFLLLSLDRIPSARYPRLSTKTQIRYYSSLTHAANGFLKFNFLYFSFHVDHYPNWT